MRLRLVCILCGLSVATNDIEDFVQGARIQEPEKGVLNNQIIAGALLLLIAK